MKGRLSLRFYSLTLIGSFGLMRMGFLTIEQLFFKRRVTSTLEALQSEFPRIVGVPGK